MSNTTKKYLPFFLIPLFFILPIYLLFLQGYFTLPKELGFGIIRIRMYSILLFSSIYSVAYFFNKYKTEDKETRRVDTFEAILWIIIPAIVGGRLWHVITDYEIYATDLEVAFELWNGGLGLFGGMIGGLIGAFLYTYKKKIKLIKSLSLLCVFLPLGQVIGRFGNLANRELYGWKTDLPWGLYISHLDKAFHPSFAYEQLGNYILFFILFIQFKYKGLQSNYIGYYLAGYGIVRFFVDFTRTEERVLMDFTVAQITSIVLILIVSGYFVKLKLFEKKKWKLWKS